MLNYLEIIWHLIHQLVVYPAQRHFGCCSCYKCYKIPDKTPYNAMQLVRLTKTKASYEEKLLLVVVA